jgi:hypothetical protein
MPTVETSILICLGDQKGVQALIVLVGMLGKSIKAILKLLNQYF